MILKTHQNKWTHPVVWQLPFPERGALPLLEIKLAKARGQVTLFGGAQQFYHRNVRMRAGAVYGVRVGNLYDMDYT
jgi:hypothetical protein